MVRISPRCWIASGPSTDFSPSGRFLLWIATRPPEQAGIAAPAPSAAILQKAVKDALVFAAERHVKRIAFRTLGAGPSPLDEIERIILIAKSANDYHDECFKAGRAAGIEEALVCHPHSSKIAAARRQLGRTVKVQEVPVSKSESLPPKAARKSTPGARKSAAPRKPTRVLLNEDDVAKAKASAGPYDRALTYAVGEFFVHPKFGVGRVEELTPEGFILVLFEGGDTRRLLHSRP
jgi:hypothetical protein